ncbi:hypothetical protein [Arthrobacter caoxuetaonis]|uniref:Uncharacterized protein n=1 Tax=Arthrobacter caoxuetaonis TaxID=2886935 RepID=A0A9X1SEB6_9MICC|nr:hypothetical protein [Arthrobacter caoxuetaonis]MCC3299486.1 hypothetical protein [Arthrobacter caoxuetaonis]USQ59022.1 hypothetical protein NF551_18120 [Arthrobacter caoxuetaonis]
MDIKRRQLLTAPGEGLLLAKSALDAVERFSDWQTATGLHPSRFVFGELCSVPLPVYTAVAPGRRQFSEVNPEVMWHPLFWLPPTIAGRYNLPTGPNGELEPESNALWSLRVALELTASGLYSQDEGWLDILHTVNIDVDSEADLARIREWQAGGHDDLLDSIDLGPYLHLEENPNWALQSALALEEPATQAQWAIVADSLMEMIWDAREDKTSNLPEYRGDLLLVSELAEVQLTHVPTEGNTAEEFWASITEALRDESYSTKQALTEGPVLMAEEWLRMTRDTFWESVTDLQTLPAAG